VEKIERSFYVPRQRLRVTLFVGPGNDYVLRITSPDSRQENDEVLSYNALLGVYDNYGILRRDWLSSVFAWSADVLALFGVARLLTRRKKNVVRTGLVSKRPIS
jgi:hypothetical protein